MAAGRGEDGVQPRIQFLWFEGCPLVDATRAALEQAMRMQKLAPGAYQNVDLMDPATPESLSGWGSPTILVDGRDVTGGRRGDGVGCRLYDTGDRVPSAEAIAEAIGRARVAGSPGA